MSDQAGKPRLLVLTSTYPRWSDDHEPGFVHELAKRLVTDFEVTVLCPSASGALRSEVMSDVQVIRYRYAPARYETLVNDGGIVTNLKRKPWKWLLVPTFILSMMLKSWREIRRLKPDVVHAHWLLPQGFVIAVLHALGLKVPRLLVTSHGADLYTLRSWLFRSAKRFVAQRASAITVVSEAMRVELARIGVETDKISVQPMGVDLSERFTPRSTQERSHDEILFVGRLVEKKGLQHLIDALPAILLARPTAFLTVAGFGPEEAERKAQVWQLGLQEKVRFLGAVPQTELPELYRRAAVFVAPFVQATSGDQEGLGLVALEAAGCGCPVVVSDLPAVREVFGRSEARLVLPGSVAALSDAIAGALSQDASSQVAIDARNALFGKFDWGVVACNYSKILRGL